MIFSVTFIVLPKVLSNFLWVFHISVSWWYFDGDWGTASFFKSPGLVSVFWPIATIQQSGWSQVFIWFLIPPVFFLNLLELFQVHQFQLVLLSSIYSTGFFLVLRVFFYIFAFLCVTLWSDGMAKSTRWKVLFSFLFICIFFIFYLFIYSFFFFVN